MGTREKKLIRPVVTVRHNDDDTGLYIDVDLAGANKESLDIDMGAAGFCVKAEGEDTLYHGCVTLGHEIMPKKAKAKFDNGLLRIGVPFKEALLHKVSLVGPDDALF